MRPKRFRFGEDAIGGAERVKACSFNEAEAFPLRRDP